MIGAVDIGGTKIAIGVFDHAGTSFFVDEIQTKLVKNDPQQGMDLIREGFVRAGLALEGIGVGCTGPVFPETGRIGTVEFLPGWTDFPLGTRLQEACGAPVVLDNDANAAALGEWVAGSGRGVKNLMMVTVGTGIGVGVILDGKIYRGAGSAHPEMGHHVIDAVNGPVCFCGAKGCFESLASGRAMENWAQLQHPEKVRLSGQQLCERAVSGDRAAKSAVKRTAHYLGIGIANLITLWMPEMICLGGSIMKAEALFLPEVYRIIRKNCGLVPYGRVKITTPILGGNAGLIGAAQVWIQSHS